MPVVIDNGLDRRAPGLRGSGKFDAGGRVASSWRSSIRLRLNPKISKVKFRGVSSGEQLDSDLRIMLFLVIILSDSLTNLCNRDAHNRIRSGVIICWPIENLDTQRALAQ